MSELGHILWVNGGGPVSVEGGLESSDVNSFFNTPLEVSGVSVEDFDFFQVNVVTWRLDVCM